MDIEKLKAEFEQSECFKRLEHVAQYTFFEFGAYIKRTDVPADIEKKCGKLITALLFSWSAWKEAKAQAVPEENSLLSATLDAVQKLGSGDFVLVDKDTIEDIKDSFSLLQEDIAVHRDYGTEHTARRDFNEILERVTKLKAMIEAQESAND
ncbi:MAG: hypothetical protein ACK4KU_00700 [Acinetobacter sp.]|uniref:hypothetical protein n=1 Tax=Acinetobacter sp. TaxID=472 RepID=UPI00391D9753